MTSDLSYNETIELLKVNIMRESLIAGKLVNPLNSNDRKTTSILCTWNQMFKAMDLAEREWKSLKNEDTKFLSNRLMQIEENLKSQFMWRMWRQLPLH